jgi:hypothetical protein
MFDSLREQASPDPFDAGSFYEDEDKFRQAEEAKPAPPRKAPRRAAPSRGGRWLGMTPFQRFALAFMLLLTVCIVGSMLLIVTGRIGLF